MTEDNLRALLGTRLTDSAIRQMSANFGEEIAYKALQATIKQYDNYVFSPLEFMSFWKVHARKLANKSVDSRLGFDII